MAKTTRYTLAYRRKREGKTNYKKRLSLLLSKKPRIAIRKSNKHFTIQLIDYVPTGDKVMVTVHSTQLPKLGWNHSTHSLPAGYLLGLAFGKKALALGQKEAIIDLGFHASIKASRLYAVVKGIVDAGMTIPVDHDMFPPDERLRGEHISTYHTLLKKPTTHTKDFITVQTKLKGGVKETAQG